MNPEAFYSFAAASASLDMRNKLKLILFASGVKPNTFLILRVNPQTLHDEHLLDRLLEDNGVVHIKNRAKSYEEIKSIKGNKILWEIVGNWIGYDLFKDERSKQMFMRYVDHLTKFEHAQADKTAGKLYDYPDCDVKQHIKERDKRYIQKNYSCYEYYKKQQAIDRAFQFVFHRAHAPDCKKSAKLNKLYSDTVKKAREAVYKEYSKTRNYDVDLLVSDESNIMIDGESIWPEKDGHEYEVVTRKPLEGKYWLISHLTKQEYKKSEILRAQVSLRYNYADVKVKGVKKGVVKGLHHERHLPLLGRVF